ncbi:MAG: sensor histidine kinase [Chloroflexi bacterium]|nr:sensor histidine kinase [Chloroflexota bacterium]
MRIAPFPLSDDRFDRLSATFNQMLTTLEKNTEDMQDLSREILQAQEVERQRVARELHDEAAQALTSLLVRLRLLERSGTPEEARLQVTELRQLTAQALEEVRKVALELRPTILDDLGLAAALGWQVDEFNGSGTAHAILQVKGVEGRLSADQELTLYRICQEALNNITRHAHAQSVDIFLSQGESWLTLEIRDDGVGFDSEAKAGSRSPLRQHRGLGLLGMRERLALVRGEFTITSRPGQGTHVLARIPLHGTNTGKSGPSPHLPGREPTWSITNE